MLARIREDGSFDAENGRVEIRYKPNDARAYRAGELNLERIAGEPVLPDDACVPGQEPAPKSDQGASAAPRKSGGKGSGRTKGAEPSPGPVPDGVWTVYADGACSGNPGPAGLGIVLVAPDGKSVEGFEYLGTATNNIAELTAILRAAELVPTSELAYIHTDSQYSIGVLSKGWKAKANQELVANVKRALSGRKNWKLVYVPGHAGVPLNERADELARQAVRTRSSRLPTTA